MSRVTRAKALAYVVMLLAVFVAIIAAATFQPRPSDRHSMPSSSEDQAPPRGLRPRSDQRYTALADELDERIRTGRLGTGARPSTRRFWRSSPTAPLPPFATPCSNSPSPGPSRTSVTSGASPTTTALSARPAARTTSWRR